MNPKSSQKSVDPRSSVWIVSWGGRFTSYLPPTPLRWTLFSTSAQKSRNQPRNVGPGTLFQPEAAKISYPNTGPPRGSLGSFGIFAFGLEVLERGHEIFDVSGLGFEVSSPVLEIMCSSRFGLLWVLGSGFELLGLGFADLGLGFGLLRLDVKVFAQRFKASRPPGLESSCAGLNPF